MLTFLSSCAARETHVRDICGVIEYEGLSDVILCGHSYGGMVITAVADRMAAKPLPAFCGAVRGDTRLEACENAIEP
jgi:pimeloyl-ACP methyl ester carboxylesterase